MIQIAILDDYQSVAMEMADWRAMPSEAQIRVFQDHLFDQDALVERLKGFDVIVAMRERTPFPMGLLKRLPRLKLLVTTGLKNASIDVQAASDLQIVVSGTRGLTYPTAELTWGLILGMLRRIPQENIATRKGEWQTGLGFGLRDKVLGVMGLGRLGSQVAAVGLAFGMKVIAWSHNLTQERAGEYGVTLVGKDDLLSVSDVLSIHLVLGDRTLGLLGKRELGLMKPTAYLVNTSRGPIVDEEALVRALSDGLIAGAALDVFDHEPLPMDHPLRRLDNVLITPHIGYVTHETYRVFFEDVVEDIRSFIEGSPIRVISKT